MAGAAAAPPATGPPPVGTGGAQPAPAHPGLAAIGPCGAACGRTAPLAWGAPPRRAAGGAPRRGHGRGAARRSLAAPAHARWAASAQPRPACGGGVIGAADGRGVRASHSRPDSLGDRPAGPTFRDPHQIVGGLVVGAVSQYRGGDCCVSGAAVPGFRQRVACASISAIAACGARLDGWCPWAASCWWGSGCCSRSPE